MKRPSPFRSGYRLVKLDDIDFDLLERLKDHLKGQGKFVTNDRIVSLAIHMFAAAVMK